MLNACVVNLKRYQIYNLHFLSVVHTNKYTLYNLTKQWMKFNNARYLKKAQKSMNFAHVEKFIHGLILTVIDNRLNKFKIWCSFPIYTHGILKRINTRTIIIVSKIEVHFDTNFFLLWNVIHVTPSLSSAILEYLNSQTGKIRIRRFCTVAYKTYCTFENLPHLPYLF